MIAVLEIERDAIKDKVVIVVWCEHGRGRSSSSSGEASMIADDLIIQCALLDHGDRHGCECLRPLWDKCGGEWQTTLVPEPIRFKKEDGR